MSNKKRSSKRQIKVPLKYNNHVVSSLSQTRNFVADNVGTEEIRAQKEGEIDSVGGNDNENENVNMNNNACLL